jgi:hypothetical protein
LLQDVPLGQLEQAVPYVKVDPESLNDLAIKGIMTGMKAPAASHKTVRFQYVDMLRSTAA